MSKQTPNMKILSPNGSTKFCLLMGSDLQNSPSPFLHSSWFMNLGMNIIYLPCQIKSENDFIKTLHSLLKVDNFHGANITMPFKQVILDAFHIKIENEIKSIGCANTLYKNNNKEWCLANTDIYGIKKTIEHLIPREINYELILLGGGSSAISTLYYCEKIDGNCLNIQCLTRNPDKTLKKFPHLANFKKLKIVDLRNINENENLILNNSTRKLIINTIPPSFDITHTIMNLINNLRITNPSSQICYFDMNYNMKPLTELNTLGVKNSSGMIMLEEQARESFFLWTGVKP